MTSRLRVGAEGGRERRGEGGRVEGWEERVGGGRVRGRRHNFFFCCFFILILIFQAKTALAHRPPTTVLALNPCWLGVEV